MFLKLISDRKSNGSDKMSADSNIHDLSYVFHICRGGGGGSNVMKPLKISKAMK